VDLSSDGRRCGWREYGGLLAIFTSSLQVSARSQWRDYTDPRYCGSSPTESATLASGKLASALEAIFGERIATGPVGSLFNTATDLTPGHPRYFKMAWASWRVREIGLRLLATANDPSGEAVVLDGNGNVVGGPHVLGNGNIVGLAANSNGSRFAALINSAGVQQVVLSTAY